MKHKASVTFQARGGIGNQLFMYAMARRLALVNQVPLLIETESGFEGDFFRRKYGLDRFHIVAEAVRWANGVVTRNSQFSRRARIAINEMLPFRFRWYLREPNATAGPEPESGFDRRILSFKVVRPLFLEGYWQDERYFADVGQQLRQDLTFSRPHTAASVELAQEMRATESVAVHMRRLNPNPPAGVDKSLDTIAILPAEYYRAAIARIREVVPQARLYIFSDSPAHAVLPIGTDDAVRVLNEDDEAQFEDLWLMSQCRHFVLANSTFSWWGAWLGRTAQSVIVSPVMSEWGQRAELPASWQAMEWRRGGGLEQRPDGRMLGARGREAGAEARPTVRNAMK